MDDIPYAAFLGVTAVDGDPTLLSLPYADSVIGRPGFLHGGAIGGFLEVASIVALRHALGIESDARIKPINLTVDFMRGGRDKPTFARGIVTGSAPASPTSMRARGRTIPPGRSPRHA
jgi:acyl-coenzyme A thioesterase PaaI-like protein